MASGDWQKALASVRYANRPVSAEQRRLGEFAGWPLGDEPRPVAAVVLRQVLDGPLGLAEPEPVSERQVGYLRDLIGWAQAADPTVEPLPPIPPNPPTRAVASAWISYLLDRRLEEGLEALRPCRGDLVLCHWAHPMARFWHGMPQPVRAMLEGEEAAEHQRTTHVISSVGESGRVFFRLGEQRAAWAPRSAWPHKLELLARGELGQELVEYVQSPG